MPHPPNRRRRRPATCFRVALGVAVSAVPMAAARDASATPHGASPVVAAASRPPVRLRYEIEGTATLRTMTRGVLPLSGSADGALDLASGAFSATFSFAEATGRFTALGFLPVRAVIDVVPLGPATGTLDEAGTTATVKLRIAVPSVSIFGLRVGGGPDCGTVRPTSATLHSTSDESPLDGISVAGVFAIPSVSGCGALTALVSPLVAGDGNAIALRLTPDFGATPAHRGRRALRN